MTTAGFRSSGDLSADRRYLWAQAAAEEGDHAGAADLFAQALELAPDWTTALFARARSLLAIDARDDAEAALRRCIALEPEDTLGAGVLLARLAPDAAEWNIPARYVAGLFDAYADRFDAHLTGALAYRGPQVLCEAVARVQLARGEAFRFRATLDLGCGTGLMAAALGQAGGMIDGVDLSQRMLEKARETGRYRRLAAGDVTAFLAQETDRYELITAADVLVYITDLAPLFSAVRRRLEGEGLFAFTVQAAGGDGYIIGDDLRAAHSAHYLTRTAQAAGLSVQLLEPVSTRKDAGEDVPGFVAVLAPI